MWERDLSQRSDAVDRNSTEDDPVKEANKGKYVTTKRRVVTLMITLVTVESPGIIFHKIVCIYIYRKSLVSLNIAIVN